MRKFFDKTWNFVKLHREYFISAAIVFLMFNFALIINANWPFGDTTPLVSDSYQQILPFAEHFFSVIRGESTLFYTNHIGGGFEIFPTLEYMLFNPFYLFVLIGGRGNVLKMFMVSWLFMLIFNALVFVWFAKKYFKNLNPFFVVIFSLLYTFSGYIVQNYSFLTWQIYPALILLVIDGFIRVVSSVKMLRFIIFLSWYVLNCFSVGVSTMIMLFIVFSGYIFFMFDKQSRKPVYARFFVSLAISVAVCVVVLLPSIVAFFGSSRSGSVLQNLIVQKNHSFLNKISVIFVDSVALILAIIYFVKHRTKQNIDKFFLFAFMVVMIPTIFDSCQKMLSGSTYQGFLSRFYFLAEALIFILALKLLNENGDEYKTENSRPLAAVIFLATLGVVALVGVVFFSLTYKNIGGNNKSQGVKINSLFFENLVVFILVAAFLITLIIFLKKQIFSKKLAKITFSVILVLSLGFNYVSFFGNGKSESGYRENIENLVSEQKIDGDIKFIGTETLSHASNTITAAHSPSIFSSLTAKEVIDFNSLIGRVTSDVYVNSASGNLILDSIAGTDYYISMQNLDRPYLTPVSQKGGVYLYKNELALTGALGFKSKLNTNEIKNYRDLIKAIQSQTNVEGDAIKQVNGKMSKKSNGDGSVEYTFIAETDGLFYISAELSKQSKEGLYEVLLVDKNTCLELAYLKGGESLTFTLKPESKYIDLNEIYFEFLDYQVAENLIFSLRQDTAEFEYTKSGFSVKTEFSEDRFVYIFAPGISGLTYTLNGKQLDGLGKFSGMVYFGVGAGEKLLGAEYKYGYTKLWIIVSAVMILLIIVLAVTYHFTKFRHVSGVITYAIYVVNCCFLVLFYFLGIILSFIGFSL